MNQDTINKLRVGDTVMVPMKVQGMSITSASYDITVVVLEPAHHRYQITMSLDELSGATLVDNTDVRAGLELDLRRAHRRLDAANDDVRFAQEIVYRIERELRELGHR